VGFFRIPGHLKGPEGISQMREGQVGASQRSPSLRTSREKDLIPDIEEEWVFGDESPNYFVRNVL
jgi:hypothetical protein